MVVASSCTTEKRRWFGAEEQSTRGCCSCLALPLPAKQGAWAPHLAGRAAGEAHHLRPRGQVAVHAVRVVGKGCARACRDCSRKEQREGDLGGRSAIALLDGTKPQRSRAPPRLRPPARWAAHLAPRTPRQLPSRVCSGRGGWWCGRSRSGRRRRSRRRFGPILWAGRQFRCRTGRRSCS